METLEGRYVFHREGMNSEQTSWRHPDALFDHTLLRGLQLRSLSG